MDAAEWHLEVERVLTQLRVTTRTDGKVEAPEPVGRGLGGTMEVNMCVLVCSSGGATWIRCINTTTPSPP